jgi:hypothetical protein
MILFVRNAGGKPVGDVRITIHLKLKRVQCLIRHSTGIIFCFVFQY